MTTETTVPESVGMPEVVLALLVSGITCLVLRVAGFGGAWTLAFGTGLLAAGCLLLAAARPTIGVPVMLTVAAAAMELELLAVAGRGLYSAAAAASTTFAGLELAGWPASPRAMVVVTLAIGAGLVTLCASSRSWRRVRDLPFDRTRGPLGRGAIVHRGENGVAHAVVCGELWRVRADGGELHDGDAVRVAHVDNDTLLVKPVRALSTD